MIGILRSSSTFRSLSLLAVSLCSTLVANPVQAVTLYASGQRLIQAVPGVHDDIRENFLFAIDSETGIATPISPQTSGLPSALAGSPDGRLLGFEFSGQVVEIDPFTATLTPLGDPAGVNATSFDILADGRGFVVPFNDNFDTQQLHAVNLNGGLATPVGSPTAVGDAVDAARGTDLGTATPFIISLGSVGEDLYGIDLDTDSLIRLNPNTGDATVVGDIGSVSSGDRAAFSGFAALTGADTDGDGSFDTLFGNVNFVDADGDPDTPVERLGGIARYNLADGTWDLVGQNPGVIFFGLGSSPASVPEPASALSLLALGIFSGCLRKRHQRQ